MVSGTVADGAERSDAQSKLVIGSQLETDRKHWAFAAGLDRVQVPLRGYRVVRAVSLSARASAAERAGASGLWWRRRAESLGVPLGDRYRHGQAHRLTLAHRETGEVGSPICTCRLLACPECERARAAKLRRRVAAVAATHDARQRERGREPALVTLTLRDSGSPAHAVEVLRAAWPPFRSALVAAGGSMGRNGSWLRAEEYTDGERGHVHWHVVCWLPEWVEYADLHRAWWRALALASDALGLPDLTTGYVSREPRPGGGCPLRVVHWRASGECGPAEDGHTRQRDRCGDEPCGRHTPGTVNVQRRSAGQGTVEAAGAYCVKAAQACGAMAYALKGAALDDRQTDDEAGRFAEYIDGRYGKRRFQGSVHFWLGGRLAPGVPVLPVERSEWSPLPAMVPSVEWPERIRAAARWWERGSD